MKTRFPLKNCLKPHVFLFVTFFSLLLVGCAEVPTVETVRAISRYGGSYIDAAGHVISEGSEVVLTRGFLLSKHPDPTLNDYMLTIHESGVSFSAHLEGLEKNTTYYVRAFAVNDVGVGYGEVLEVFTAAVAMVQTGLVKVISNTEAILSASVDERNSETEIMFDLWKDGENTRIVEVQKTDSQSMTGISAHVTDLSPGVEYFYRVRVQNAAGVATGETKSFNTFYEKVSDFDGNNYWTVKIGNQVWLESNLKTTHFLNGDPIPHVQPLDQWVNLNSPAWCVYAHSTELGAIYGLLYNIKVGLDSRGLIAGYHLPSIEECQILTGYLGGQDEAGEKLKSSTDLWYKNGKGNNSSGFNALPGGWRGNNEMFSGLNYYIVFQTSTTFMGYFTGFSIRYASFDASGIGYSPGNHGRYIRLLKDE